MYECVFNVVVRDLLRSLFWLTFCHFFQDDSQHEQNYLFTEASKLYLQLQLFMKKRRLEEQHMQACMPSLVARLSFVLVSTRFADIRSAWF